MKIVNDAIDHLARSGGMTNLPGWYYDIVVDRLEKLGFKLQEKVDFFPHGDLEGSIYQHPLRGRFKVVTSRFHGPFTIIESTPSSEKPKGKG